MKHIDFLADFLPQILQDNKTVITPESVLKNCKLVLPRILENTDAMYQLHNDTVYIPSLKSYNNSSEYYRVLFHELAHSTAHHSRIGREMNANNRSYMYAIEELIAEFSSILLCHSTGILSDTLPLHCEYVNAWYKQLWFFSFGRYINKDIRYCVTEAEKVYQCINNPNSAWI